MKAERKEELRKLAEKEIERGKRCEFGRRHVAADAIKELLTALDEAEKLSEERMRLLDARSKCLLESRQECEALEAKVALRDGALELACEELAVTTGSCPADLYGEENINIDCQESCNNDTDKTEGCFMDYYLSQAEKEGQ